MSAKTALDRSDGTRELELVITNTTNENQPIEFTIDRRKDLMRDPQNYDVVVDRFFIPSDQIAPLKESGASAGHAWSNQSVGVAYDGNFFDPEENTHQNQMSTTVIDPFASKSIDEIIESVNIGIQKTWYDYHYDAAIDTSYGLHRKSRSTGIDTSTVSKTQTMLDTQATFMNDSDSGVLGFYNNADTIDNTIESEVQGHVGFKLVISNFNVPDNPLTTFANKFNFYLTAPQNSGNIYTTKTCLLAQNVSIGKGDTISNIEFAEHHTDVLKNDKIRNGYFRPVTLFDDLLENVAKVLDGSADEYKWRLNIVPVMNFPAQTYDTTQTQQFTYDVHFTKLPRYRGTLGWTNQDSHVNMFSPIYTNHLANMAYPFRPPYFSIDKTSESQSKITFNYSTAWNWTGFQIVMTPGLASLLGFAHSALQNDTSGVGWRVIDQPPVNFEFYTDVFSTVDTESNSIFKNTNTITQPHTTANQIHDLWKFVWTTTLPVDGQIQGSSQTVENMILTDFLAEKYVSDFYTYNLTGYPSRRFRMTSQVGISSFSIRLMLQRSDGSSERVFMSPGKNANLKLLFVPTLGEIRPSVSGVGGDR